MAFDYPIPSCTNIGVCDKSAGRVITLVFIGVAC